MFVDPDDPKSIAQARATTNLINGTFPSGNSVFTANTTEIAAQATWNFLQAWFTNFPR